MAQASALGTPVDWLIRSAYNQQAGWHTAPGRVLAVWLDGEVEFEVSDGEVRRVPAGSCVLVEDAHGKGHISCHPAEGQGLILITFTNGLDLPR
jgi:hypothetical protein